MSEQKLYIATTIGEAHEERVCQYIDTFDRDKSFDTLKTVPKNRLHVTLAFLGYMERAQGERILARAAGVAPFDAFVGEPQAFGGRVLFLRVYGSGLIVLNRIFANAYREVTGRNLQGAGPSFTPHVAIAKSPGREENTFDVGFGLKALQDSPAMEFTVKKVGLYCKSELLAEVSLEGIHASAF